MGLKYFLMTNQKGDYGCFLFNDYNLYKKCWIEYNNMGWVDEEEYLKKIT
tara:strand:+ start:489 stop:638 length:150 start_codon:yes stop_codon:yes gene_type:complete